MISSSYNLPNIARNLSRGDLYLNSNRNSEHKLESLIESTLSKNFEFYNDFTITPYTFNSFFLVIFRNWTSRSKLKFIKALEDQKFTEFILTTEKTKKMKDKENNISEESNKVNKKIIKKIIYKEKNIEREEDENI